MTQFEDEGLVNGSHYLKPVEMTKMFNIAADNVKQSKTAVRKVNAAEEVRDVFGRRLTGTTKTSDARDLHYILSDPVTEVSLSLAHSDGTLP